jgi:hypothetical protein
MAWVTTASADAHRRASEVSGWCLGQELIQSRWIEANFRSDPDMPPLKLVILRLVSVLSARWTAWQLQNPAMRLSPWTRRLLQSIILILLLLQQLRLAFGDIWRLQCGDAVQLHCFTWKLVHCHSYISLQLCVHRNIKSELVFQELFIMILYMILTIRWLADKF